MRRRPLLGAPDSDRRARPPHGRLSLRRGPAPRLRGPGRRDVLPELDAVSHERAISDSPRRRHPRCWLRQMRLQHADRASRAVRVLVGQVREARLREHVRRARPGSPAVAIASQSQSVEEKSLSRNAAVQSAIQLLMTCRCRLLDTHQKVLVGSVRSRDALTQHRRMTCVLTAQDCRAFDLRAALHWRHCAPCSLP